MRKSSKRALFSGRLSLSGNKITFSITRQAKHVRGKGLLFMASNGVRIESVTLPHIHLHSSGITVYLRGTNRKQDKAPATVELPSVEWARAVYDKAEAALIEWKAAGYPVDGSSAPATERDVVLDKPQARVKDLLEQNDKLEVRIANLEAEVLGLEGRLAEASKPISKQQVLDYLRNQMDALNTALAKLEAL